MAFAFFVCHMTCLLKGKVLRTTKTYLEFMCVYTYAYTTANFDAPCTSPALLLRKENFINRPNMYTIKDLSVLNHAWVYSVQCVRIKMQHS